MIIGIRKKLILTSQYVIINLLLVLSLGCSMAAPQVESSYTLISNLLRTETAPPEEKHATWLASVGNRGEVLRPYLSGGLTVFANAEGNAIAFDGWTIRSIVGFGLDEAISISGKEGTRLFSTKRQVTSTECDSWRLSGLVWQQICATGDSQIVLNKAGHIEFISMSLGEPLGIVTLTMVK